MARRLMTAIPMTPAGRQALEEELAHLKQTRLPQVREWIRSESQAPPGDLADAAELSEAQLEQLMLEARIAGLELILSEAEVMERYQPQGLVDIGSP